jgi:hypothetical protein
VVPDFAAPTTKKFGITASVGLSDRLLIAFPSLILYTAKENMATYAYFRKKYNIKFY